MIKFYVNVIKPHKMMPILLDEVMMKYVNSRDEKMIRDLYQHTFSHIRYCIDEI